ncbi:MAG: VOC family protein [Pseudobdellovibrio sp.]
MFCHFILYVSDQRISSTFYSRALDQQPTLDVPGMTEFKLGEGCILGLMPSKGIKKLLGEAIQDPENAKGVPRAEVYLRVSNPELAFMRALEAGAKLLSPIEQRNWGARAGYLEDPDGHVIAFSDYN